MAIEKRTLPGGEVVGFDTKRNSYCNFPKDEKKLNAINAIEALEAMSAEALANYALQHGIDTGKATTAEGLLDKIKKAKGLV